MASSLFNEGSLQETLLSVSKLAAPTSYADAAALGAVFFASAGYLLREYTWDKPDPYNYKWFERPQAKDGAGVNARKETRNIAKKLEEAGKDVVVFWGSQSGTAERFANRLARELHQRFGLEAMAADLSDYDSETIALIPQAKIAFFLLSTFGEGDPSDNTSGFWDYLTKSKEVTLPNLRYAAFGLGNSNYKYYNRVVDVADKALSEFGAKQLLPVGKADDAEGATEEDFLDWKENLFVFLHNDLGYKEAEVRHEPTLRVVEDDSLEPIDLHIGEPVHPRDNPKSAAACSQIKPLKIRNSRELFTSSTRNCIHMELDLTEHPQLTYKTGDHLAIWPTNPDEELERLIKALGIQERRAASISLLALDETTKIKIPTPTTIETVFRHYLEICAPVSRDFVRSLIQFAPTDNAKAFLTELSQNKETYNHFLSRTYLTAGKLLELADANTIWSTIPISYIFESLPRSQPRYYSISSSSVLAPRVAAITALVSNSELPNDPTSFIPGLTSNYLLSLSQSISATTEIPANAPAFTYRLAGPSDSLADGKLFAHFRKSKFKLPMLSSCPIIMVAAGTGVAPFRAFISERARLKAMGKPVGEMILFFGCRDPEEDYIYRSEFEELESKLEGQLRIVTAFSRVKDQKKVYVQNRVEELGSDVVKLLGEGGNLYICGRASMAREVGKRVGEVMGKEKEMSEAEVKDKVGSLKRSNKWQEDVWG